MSTDITIPKMTPATIFNMGVEKTGKTHIASSFPGPKYWIYADKNFKCQQKFMDKANDGSHREDYTTWAELNGKVIPELRARDNDYKTIVVDTISNLAKARLKELVGPGKATYDHWGIFKHNLENLVENLVELALPKDDHPGYNIVVNCHLKKTLSGEDILEGYDPMIQGSTANSIRSYFDSVFVTQQVTDLKGDTTYKLYTSPPSKFYTGIGDGIGGGLYGRLPDVIELKDSDSAYDVLMGHWQKTNTKK